MVRKTPFFHRCLPNLSKFCQPRINIYIFRCLPFVLSRRYLAAIGRLYYFLKRTEKESIQRTISDLFGKRLKSITLHTIIQKTFKGIFDHYHEKQFIAYSRLKTVKKFLTGRIHVVGQKGFQEALAAGKGIILVTGHYGAVEFLPGVLALKGYKVTMILRFQTQSLAESLIARARQVNLELINATQGNVFLAATKALKEGRILITECDEFDEWRVTNHKQIDFLGCKLAYDRTLDILQKRSGAPVFTALLKREDQGQYRLNFTAITNQGTSKDMAVGELCLKVLDKAIQESPEQWYQWKKFGKLTKSQLEEVNYGHQQDRYLASEVGIPFPLQA